VPEWQDDVSVDDDTRLWRRILVDDPAQIKQDPNTGEPRPSSGAFRSTTELVSITIVSSTMNSSDYLAEFPKHSLVEITARAVRDADCIIVREPTPEDPGHANIISNKREDGLLTPSQARKISRTARWVVYKAP